MKNVWKPFRNLTKTSWQQLRSLEKSNTEPLILLSPDWGLHVSAKTWERAWIQKSWKFMSRKWCGKYSEILQKVSQNQKSVDKLLGFIEGSLEVLGFQYSSLFYLAYNFNTCCYAINFAFFYWFLVLVQQFHVFSATVSRFQCKCKLVMKFWLLL